jgi:hypothetical protein
MQPASLLPLCSVGKRGRVVIPERAGPIVSATPPHRRGAGAAERTVCKDREAKAFEGSNPSPSAKTSTLRWPRIRDSGRAPWRGPRMGANRRRSMPFWVARVGSDQHVCDPALWQREPRVFHTAEVTGSKPVAPTT